MKLISDIQGSGKASSTTSDHLMISRFLIDNYVNLKGKKIFSCFVDLQKAYDTVPRIKLFHSVLKDYSIGAKFLKIIHQIYSNNQVFIKLRSEARLRFFNNSFQSIR